jgi:hypothetical protein
MLPCSDRIIMKQGCPRDYGLCFLYTYTDIHILELLKTTQMFLATPLAYDMFLTWALSR